MRTLLSLTLLAACGAPDAGDAFNTFEILTTEDAEGATFALLEVAEASVSTLDVALPALEDLALAEAFVAAHERGVDVRVVTDVDRAADAGVLALQAANVPLRLADGPLGYFDFGTNNDVGWSSDQVRMTHAFAVADRDRIALASSAGDLGAGPRVVVAGQSEELAEDLITEHTQLFGGVDATARTAFDAMAKSIADIRWAYWSEQDEIVEVWFNPQERLQKRLTDAVYGARSSIRVITEDFADEGFARALQQKAEDGFDVEVLVGASFGTTSAALSDVLRNRAPSVRVLQSLDTTPLPTIVYVDYDRARDGRFHMPKAMVLTHPVISAARLFAGEEVVTDQLTDGALVVVSMHGAPSLPLQALADVYVEARTRAESLR